jgi:hypothetical protein
MFGTSGGHYNEPGGGGRGLVLTGCGCSPIGLLLSVVVSAVMTLLANLFLRRRY